MLVFDRQKDSSLHSEVCEIGTWLGEGDLLVLNRARVEKARVPWTDPKGRDQELVLLRPLDGGKESSRWEAIVSGKNLPLSEPLALPGGRSFQKLQSGSTAEIVIDASVQTVREWLEEKGLPPLPPYIRKERRRHGEAEDEPSDCERYQTTFAEEGGAVAAPTAGLHFSDDLLNALRGWGVEIATIHLAVGWGTFQPMTQELWERGRLHEEEVTVSRENASLLLQAMKEGRRIVAVGTTVVRALEWWHQQGRPEEGLKGACDLFLRPPWKPSVISALLTNFHLPQSSLLALVGAFCGDDGEKTILRLYKEAIENEYRFFSYGDCMLIL